MPDTSPAAAQLPASAEHGLRRMFSHPTLLLAGAAAFSLSTLFSAMKPIMLTRMLEEAAIGEAVAGTIVAAPFAGIAISSVLFYFRPPRASVRALGAVFGLSLVLLEWFSATLFPMVGALLVMQFAAGFCVGALMAATSRIIAVSSAPDESFGFIDMSAVAMMSLMVAGLGRAVAADGTVGGYHFAAGASLLFTLLIVVYREPGSVRVHHEKYLGLPALTLRPVAVILMGMLFVTCSGLGFVFMFSMAAELGMDYAMAGDRIGILLVVSALDCLAGGWCSRRYGPRYPLLCAFLVCAVGWWFAVHTASTTVFFIALVPSVFALQFNFPILLALSGALDEHGRWAGIAAPLITSGFAWAAIAAGLVVENFGMAALASVNIVGMALCALLLWPATTGDAPQLDVVPAHG